MKISNPDVKVPASPGEARVSRDEYRKGKRSLSHRDRLFVENYLSNGGCIRQLAPPAMPIHTTWATAGPQSPKCRL
jgi:hypothetical protein